MTITPRPTPGEDTQIVAANIRSILGRLDISRRELADRTKDSPTPISAPQMARFAKGERSPDIEELRTIADALGVSLAALLSGIDGRTDEPPIDVASGVVKGILRGPSL